MYSSLKPSRFHTHPFGSTWRTTTITMTTISREHVATVNQCALYFGAVWSSLVLPLWIIQQDARRSVGVVWYFPKLQYNPLFPAKGWWCHSYACHGDLRGQTIKVGNIEAVETYTIHNQSATVENQDVHLRVARQHALRRGVSARHAVPSGGNCVHQVGLACVCNVGIITTSRAELSRR